MSTVYIMEDDALLCELVRSYVEHLGDVEILGTSADGSVAMKEILELRPEIVLADIRVPEVNGLEVLYLLKRRIPEAKVIIFTGTPTAEAIRLAYDGGVDGFVEKSSGLEAFLRAIEAVRANKRYFDPHVAKTLIELKGPDVALE